MQEQKPYTRLENAFGSILLAGALLSLLVTELLNTLNPVVRLPLVNTLLSLLFILFLETLFLGLFKRVSLAVSCTHLLVALLSLANHFKQYFRGDPLFAGDVIMAGALGDIASDLRYTPDVRIWVAALVFLLTIWLASRSKRRISGLRPRLLLTSASIVAIVLLMTGVFWNPQVRKGWLGLRDYSWNALADTRENGFMIPFLRSTQALLPSDKLEAPIPKSDYLISTQSDMDPSKGQSPAQLGKPNVIVVMSESFCDLERINPLRTSEPVMPFFRQLQQSENTISGSLLVSIFGGNTSNTEFEFLTGSSMYFVNDGLFPFKSWFHHPTHGLVDLFNQQGYRSVAIHPFWSDFYDRTRVYENLGFSEFIALEQFSDDAKKIHGYISDQAHVERIIETYESKPTDERLFLFSITMQNHFPYDRAEEGIASLPYQVRLPDMPQETSAELFLSLLRVSDDALKQLIQYFDTVEEPTMIVLFGDHLPGLSESLRPFYKKLAGKDFAQLDLMETRMMFETPFMIWANYPLPEDQIDVTSPNFLSVTVAQLADATLSPYYTFVHDLTKNFSAVSNRIIVLQDGTTVDRDHIPKELTYELNQYRRYHVDNIIQSDH